MKKGAFVEVITLYTCPLCHSKPGERCVSVSKKHWGRTCITIHNERLRAAGYGTTKKQPHPPEEPTL